MAKWVPDSYLELILDKIASSDEEAICSAQPATFFNAHWPDMWVALTTYAVGDCVYPPTQNGFIYECIVAGDAGAVEPGWLTEQDAEFTDGTVTWKTHENYALANEDMAPSDFTKADGDIDGRKLMVAQKMGVVTHTAGTVTHAALLTKGTAELHFVTEASTTLAEDNDVEAGRSTIFFEFDVTMRDPQ
jgi:hypothetical protein